MEKSAEQGNQYAQYQLGKLYLMGEQTEKDVDTALSYLKQAAEQGNQYAQYVLGKLYLMGQDVPRDMELAVEYLTRSVEQGNAYAQYFLDHRNDWQNASVGSAVLRMLHHMSRIFQDNAVADSTYRGLQIDKKRRQAIRHNFMQC